MENPDDWPKPKTSAWPIVDRSECGICRRPIDIARSGRTTITFEANDTTTPHRCPDEAMIQFRQKIRLMKMKDPRFSGMARFYREWTGDPHYGESD